ncbi:hypothetical protein ACTJKH_12090 [Microbacterium sp. 22215]|uniref:hypothetical protein n=1 Tax=Microbacterium sp. 22215 TaxID=3453893 RepID=UPI003F83BDC4
MTADVNWLLSSIAQGSAAMIAIVGGLLVSRYVGLHAEQEAARRRVDDLKSRATAATDLGTRLESELRALQIKLLVNRDDVYNALIHAGLDLSLDELFALTGEDRSSYDEEDVSAQLAILGAEIKSAAGVLLKRVSEELEHPQWSRFRSRNLDLPIENDDAWEWTYSRICADKRAAAVDALPQMQRLAHIGAAPLDLSRLVPSDEPSRRRQLIERIERAQADARGATQEAALAQEAFESSRQPAGFSLALQVLTTLAILGIAVPVVVMGIGLDALDLWVRVLVILVFFVGVALLLRYLFVYASFLREGGRRTLPRHVFGLIGKERPLAEDSAV